MAYISKIKRVHSIKIINMMKLLIKLPPLKKFNIKIRVKHSNKWKVTFFKKYKIEWK